MGVVGGGARGKPGEPREQNLEPFPEKVFLQAIPSTFWPLQCGLLVQSILEYLKLSGIFNSKLKSEHLGGSVG